MMLFLHLGLACELLIDRFDKVTSIYTTLPKNIQFFVPTGPSDLKAITVETLNSTSFVSDNAFIQNLNVQVQQNLLTR